MRDKERHRLYHVWHEMRDRCGAPSHPQFANYGGRGIAVCERWASFDNFLADMGPRPSRAHSVDRTDNDGPYSPENCRWATRTQQNSNRRNCIFVEVAGELVTLKEACRRLGLTYRPIGKRIKNLGWPVSLALSTPIGQAPHFFQKEHQ